jgi:hypothetical protein
MKRPCLTITLITLLLLAGNARAASIAPSVLELEGQKGHVTEATIRVINTDSTEHIYFLGKLEFNADSQDGSPSFSAFDSKSNGLGSWIVFENEQVAVPANSFVDAPFSISVPQEAQSGSHHTAVTVSPAPSDVVATNGAIIEAKTAMLIFMTVEGETRVLAGLLDFTSDLFDRIVTDFSGTFTYRLQNQGNVFLKPQGTITLTDIFGRSFVILDANESLGRVLPGTTRAFFTRIPEDFRPFALGPVVARLDLTMAEQGKTLGEQATFLYLPARELLISLALLILIAIIFKKTQNK